MKHIHIFIIRYNNIDNNFQDAQFKHICFKLLIEFIKSNFLAKNYKEIYKEIKKALKLSEFQVF